MEQSTSFPVISFGTATVTLYTSNTSLLGNPIGGNTASNFSFSERPRRVSDSDDDGFVQARGRQIVSSRWPVPKPDRAEEPRHDRAARRSLRSSGPHGAAARRWSLDNPPEAFQPCSAGLGGGADQDRLQQPRYRRRRERRRQFALTAEIWRRAGGGDRLLQTCRPALPRPECRERDAEVVLDTRRLQRHPIARPFLKRRAEAATASSSQQPCRLSNSGDVP